MGVPEEIAEYVKALHDLRNALNTTTFDYQIEAPAYVDSTRMYKAFNIQDYVRALQLGGYGYSILFPRPAAALTANNDYPLSLFNNGQKTLLVYSIEVANVTAAGSAQVHMVTRDGNYGGPLIAPFTNHKGGISNGPSVNATYSQTAGLTAPTANMVDFAAYGANSIVEVIANNNVYPLPTKTGMEVWIRVLTASVAWAKIDVVELPF